MSTDRQLNIAAARIAGKDPQMRVIANRVMGEIKTVATPNKDSGDYIESLEIITTTGRNGVTDHKVISTLPGAIAIEYGHLAGKKGTADRPFVPGQFIMTRAANNIRKGM